MLRYLRYVSAILSYFTCFSSIVDSMTIYLIFGISTPLAVLKKRGGRPVNFAQEWPFPLNLGSFGFISDGFPVVRRGSTVNFTGGSLPL